MPYVNLIGEEESLIGGCNIAQSAEFYWLLNVTLYLRTAFFQLERFTLKIYERISSGKTMLRKGWSSHFANLSTGKYPKFYSV
jgi:hypothetical protein